MRMQRLCPRSSQGKLVPANPQSAQPRVGHSRAFPNADGVENSALPLPSLRSAQQWNTDEAAHHQDRPVLLQMKLAAINGASVRVENVAAAIFAVPQRDVA